MNLDTLDGTQLIGIVIGLTEVVKKFKVPPRYCLVVAIGTGVVLQVAIEAAFQYPTLSPWVAAAITGLVRGLTATGLYAVARGLVNRNNRRF